MSGCSGRRRSAWAEGSHLHQTGWRLLHHEAKTCTHLVRNYVHLASIQLQLPYVVLVVLDVLVVVVVGVVCYVSSPRSTARLPYWEAWVARGRYYFTDPHPTYSTIATHSLITKKGLFALLWDQIKSLPRILIDHVLCWRRALQNYIDRGCHLLMKFILGGNEDFGPNGQFKGLFFTIVSIQWNYEHEGAL